MLCTSAIVVVDYIYNIRIMRMVHAKTLLIRPCAFCVKYITTKIGRNTINGITNSVCLLGSSNNISVSMRLNTRSLCCTIQIITNYA